MTEELPCPAFELLLPRLLTDARPPISMTSLTRLSSSISVEKPVAKTGIGASRRTNLMAFPAAARLLTGSPEAVSFPNKLESLRCSSPGPRDPLRCSVPGPQSPPL